MRIVGSGKEKQCDTSQSKAAMSCMCDCLQLVNKKHFYDLICTNEANNL